MYFFIDPANLPATQAVGDAYGPLSTDLTNRYNVTSKFQLANEAKAFACQKGLMVVQQSTEDTSLVNVIIKPNSDPKVPVNVKYYIYRGILKSSLIGDDTCITGQDASNNELIARIWLDPPTEPVCGTLGYMEDTDPTPVTELVDRIFDYDITGIDPIVVKEGEWFGTFTKDHKIGFEILLKTNRFKATLNYVRAGDHEINVTGLTNYAERIKREEILNFIDPAAFFGMHYKETVSYYDTAGTNNTRTTNTTSTSSRFIYTKLISKFHTRNKVYIDIRSEKGYSYNFYQNYKVSATDADNIQVRANTNYVTQVYQTENWPILILESTHNSGSTNSLRMHLRVDDNTDPILYMKKLKYGNGSTDHIKITENTTRYIRGLKDGTNVTWTTEFRLKFPNHIRTGTVRNYISNYAKLHYFRTTHNAASVSPVLINEKYYDSAFCAIDIPDIGNVTNHKRYVEGAEPIYVREPDNTDGTGNFQLNMSNGAYWDDARILFYAVIEYENSEKTSEKEYINTYTQKFEFASCSYFNEYCDSELYRRTEIICRNYLANGTVRIPAINFYKSKNSSAGISKNHKENAMLLGLTLAELSSIKNDTQIDTAHHRFIHLVASANNPVTNAADNIRHFEYELQLQGLDANGQRTIVTPQHNGAAITLYSRDNQFFSSAAFSATVPLTTGQNNNNQINRIEFHVYHDGVVKINDNIDFALIHDLQRIYYKYHANNNNMPVDICNLEMVMANKMRRRTYQASPRITDYPIAQLPALNTLTFLFDYETEGVNLTTSNGVTYSGVDAGRTYADARGDIFVRPRQSNPGYNGFRWYRNQKWTRRNEKAKCFLVKFVTNITRNQPPSPNTYITSITFANAAPNIDLQFRNTLRLYPNPALAAVMIGALIEFNNQVTCQGFAYENASCYPSAEHVNGEAADTDYQTTTQRNVDYILALRRFGVNLFRIGNTNHGTSNGIYNHASIVPIRNIIRRDGAGSTLHQTHLHSSYLPNGGGVRLNDGNKTL